MSDLSEVGGKVLLWLLIGIPVALMMEPWSAFVHGRLWHGSLWGWHRSHHEPRTGRFERNDIFALLHAPPAILMILYGCLGPPGIPREVIFAVGLGMSAFGLSYAVVHDGLIHGRLPVAFLGRLRLLRRIAAAHKVHHERNAEPFGLFRGPAELRRLAGHRSGRSLSKR